MMKDECRCGSSSREVVMTISLKSSAISFAKGGELGTPYFKMVFQGGALAMRFSCESSGDAVESAIME